METNRDFAKNLQESQGIPFPYFKEVKPISKDKNLEFCSGVSANLLFHVLNIYGLLGNHGRTYKEVNETIGDSPDNSIQAELLERREDNYERIVRAFVDLDPKSPVELIEAFNSSDDEVVQLFSKALAKSWGKYKDYWDTVANQLHEDLQVKIEVNPWSEYAKKMEMVSGANFETDIHLVAAEALKESAMYVPPNISIGSMKRYGDAGFVHEGLHLLLKEDWASEPRISNLVPVNWHDDFWRSNWRAKFEQAVVVSLDNLIRSDKQPIANYFKGCRVAGLERFFYGPIKDWYERKLSGQTEEALSDVIYNVLSSNREELIESFLWTDDSLSKKNH